jgi:hypothetical protein
MNPFVYLWNKLFVELHPDSPLNPDHTVAAIERYHTFLNDQQFDSVVNAFDAALIEAVARRQQFNPIIEVDGILSPEVQLDLIHHYQELGWKSLSFNFIPPHYLNKDHMSGRTTIAFNKVDPATVELTPPGPE